MPAAPARSRRGVADQKPAAPIIARRPLFVSAWRFVLSSSADKPAVKPTGPRWAASGSRRRTCVVRLLELGPELDEAGREEDLDHAAVVAEDGLGGQAAGHVAELVARHVVGAGPRKPISVTIRPVQAAMATRPCFVSAALNQACVRSEPSSLRPAGSQKPSGADAPSVR